MKSNRRKFFRNLGAGAAGLTLGSSGCFIDIRNIIAPGRMKTDRYSSLAIILLLRKLQMEK